MTLRCRAPTFPGNLRNERNYLSGTSLKVERNTNPNDFSSNYHGARGEVTTSNRHGPLDLRGTRGGTTVPNRHDSSNSLTVGAHGHRLVTHSAEHIIFDCPLTAQARADILRGTSIHKLFHTPKGARKLATFLLHSNSLLRPLPERPESRPTLTCLRNSPPGWRYRLYLMYLLSP